MVVDGFIFKNNQITLSPCFTFVPKAGMALPKTGASFFLFFFNDRYAMKILLYDWCWSADLHYNWEAKIQSGD